MTAPRTIPSITAEQASVLAAHATFVQGGYSTPEIESERALADYAHTGVLPDFERMAREIAAVKAAPKDLPMAKLMRYKELRATQGAIEAEAGAIKEEADILERELVEAFTDAATQRLTVDGKTIYLHRATFAQRAEGVTADQIREALLECAPSLVTSTVNSNTLSAYVREFLDADEPRELPEPLRDLLELGERYSVRVTAAGKSGRKAVPSA